jgi:hypothetical protein
VLGIGVGPLQSHVTKVPVGRRGLMSARQELAPCITSWCVNWGTTITQRRR